eukprot:scpid71364/ scgid3600/ 
MANPWLIETRGSAWLLPGASGRGRMLLNALLLLLIGAAEFGESYIYVREAYRHWNDPSISYFDQGLTVESNAPQDLLYRVFEMPADIQYNSSQLHYDTYFYVVFRWETNPECTADVVFYSNSLTRTTDYTDVYSNNPGQSATLAAALNGDLSNNVVTLSHSEVQIHFISMGTPPTDIGFSGSFESVCSLRRRRKRAAGQKKRAMPRHKLRKVYQHSGRLSKNETHIDRSKYEHIMKFKIAMLLGKVSMAEACDSNCTTRQLMSMHKCCEHWQKNGITPNACPGRRPSAASDLELCSPHYPLQQKSRLHRHDNSRKHRNRLGKRQQKQAMVIEAKPQK